MPIFIIDVLKSVAFWFAKEAVKAAVKIVRDVVSEVEKIDVEQLTSEQKREAAFNRIKDRFEASGYEIVSDVKDSAKQVSFNYINYLIEKEALKHP